MQHRRHETRRPERRCPPECLHALRRPGRERARCSARRATARTWIPCVNNCSANGVPTLPVAPMMVTMGCIELSSFDVLSFSTAEPVRPPRASTVEKARPAPAATAATSDAYSCLYQLRPLPAPKTIAPGLPFRSHQPAAPPDVSRRPCHTGLIWRLVYPGCMHFTDYAVDMQPAGCL